MSKGWVKLHRSLFDNDLWTAEPFTKGQAWIDLFANANHSPQSFWVREVEVRVDRGQLAWSEVTMAKRWQWSRGKVRRYLGMLKTRQMIEQQSDNVTSIITICNYRDFQDVSTASNTVGGTADGTPSSTADGQQTVHKQEGLELENEKNTKDSPTPAKPDAKALRKRQAIELMTLWNQAKAEHDTNWTAVDDPEHTSAKRYSSASARAEYVKQRLKRNGKPHEWEDVHAWFTRFYSNLASDPFYSGRPNDRNPSGYKATFEQVHAEEYFIKAIERLTQGWNP